MPHKKASDIVICFTNVIINKIYIKNQFMYR